MNRVIAFIALFALAALLAGEVQGLEIQVAPHTLVVSSGGGNVTIHTDFPGFPGENATVVLEIEPEGGSPATVTITDHFLDDRGFYVVRCDRQAAAAAVGPFQRKFTTAIVTLCIDGHRGSEEIAVRK